LHEHLVLAKLLTAERKIEEFVSGKGVVVKWERLRRQNHWFDALYNASAAAHFCGVRLVEEPKNHPSQAIGRFGWCGGRMAGRGSMRRVGGNGWAVSRIGRGEKRARVRGVAALAAGMPLADWPGAAEDNGIGPLLGWG
jgi:hypothetical protein